MIGCIVQCKGACSKAESETHETLHTVQMLYQLSYQGISAGLHANSVNKTRQGNAQRQLIVLKRKKNEVLQAGFKPTMFCVLGRHSTN